MGVHRIRLQAPWRQELVEPESVRWRRTFHRPTNLSPAERVWIVVAPVPAGGSAQLNGHALGALAANSETRFEVTALLAANNTLELLGPCPRSAPPEPPAGVHLEIGE